MRKHCHRIAHAEKPGKFELAHQGAIFLDEIGDMDPRLQAKLLQVLQDEEFYRVGGTRSLRVDARVVVATNRDLEKDIANGRFRQDLYCGNAFQCSPLFDVRSRCSRAPAE